MAEFRHVILFTGHMIDAPGRNRKRFPAPAEAAARCAIADSIRDLLAGIEGDAVVGIAGGASGSDILFHEVCERMEVPTLMRLALPVERYIEVSVAPAGGDWVERFRQLLERIGPDAVQVLDDSVNLPESFAAGADLNIWQRTNLWMVDEALRLAPHQTLLALWDGEAGDGPGGTGHLIEIVPRFGIVVAPIIRTQTFVPPMA